MAMQRVAELVRRASKDTGVIAALRNDPSQLPKSLDLNAEHMNALRSASAFNVPSAAKPAAKAVLLGAVAAATPAPDGTLLPPEGSGGGPAVITLPPVAKTPVAAPVSKPPTQTPAAPVSKPPVTAPAGPVMRPPVSPPVMTPITPVHAPGLDQPPHDTTHEPTQPTQVLASMVAGCDCDCSVAIAAIVANVSMTANTAIAALTAIASSD